jgi:hypothetical protein
MKHRFREGILQPASASSQITSTPALLKIRITSVFAIARISLATSHVALDERHTRTSFLSGSLAANIPSASQNQRCNHYFQLAFHGIFLE